MSSISKASKNNRLEHAWLDFLLGKQKRLYGDYVVALFKGDCYWGLGVYPNKLETTTYFNEIYGFASAFC